jgi:cyclophilin family peptidyl-prolyl cis-trans isomerase/HEAT repeat protein
MNIWTKRILLFAFISFAFQITQAQNKNAVPLSTQIQILKAEDERRYDDKLEKLLSDKNVLIAERAALAAGRIGNEKAIEPLTKLLRHNGSTNIRAMAAFALGEIESDKATKVLLETLEGEIDGEVKAREVEALGKIGATFPQAEKEKRETVGNAILKAIDTERNQTHSELQVILKGLTAALRVRPTNAGVVIAKFLNHQDNRVRQNATNALARLRAKDGNEEVRKLLVSDKDPIVRANAARVLGATEDKESIDALLERATKDADSRVRVSAIRALAGLGQRGFKIGTPLIERGETLLAGFKKAEAAKVEFPSEQNELLEIATTLGRVLRYTQDERTVSFLRDLRISMNYSAPEVEIAFARVNSETYLNEAVPKDWKQESGIAGVAQGLGEIANVESKSEEVTREIHGKTKDKLAKLMCLKEDGKTCKVSQNGLADTLRAYAAFKPNNLDKILRQEVVSSITSIPKSFMGNEEYLSVDDVIVRATAADLLGDLPPSEENTKTLVEALLIAYKDELNDAVLSILDALGKQKNDKANEAIKTALKSEDHLIRRRAVQILKANGVGDFSSEIGYVQTKNKIADYKRALARKNGSVKAIIETKKGSFTINLLPEDAPLTVDNFVMLAKKNYFKGVTFHRVVANFVIQGGDPRGDGNGGPGYSIRCEINEVEYYRGTVGMALSGKDTGGSQWFVTHSPQPHLDGGYTVFGYVDEKDMKVVDSIARGNRILNVRIVEKKK